MKKNYNFTRRKLHLPEYGRHIQEMIDSLLTIEDRTERTRQTKAVIAVMGNLNPLLRDTADFTHKLWDHLFIMSDFQLDVDSPYPQPSREELTVKPRHMSYSQQYISFKHYGKYVGKMIRVIADNNNGDMTSTATADLARYMRSKSYEYNLEHPNNEVIIKDIKTLAKRDIKLDEEAINNIRSDYKQNFSPYQNPQNKGGQRTGGMNNQRRDNSRGGKPQQRTGGNNQHSRINNHGAKQGQRYNQNR